MQIECLNINDKYNLTLFLVVDKLSWPEYRKYNLIILILTIIIMFIKN